MWHFLDIKDFDKERLSALLDTAHDMKSGHDVGRPLEGLHIGMIFEKPSTRTRVSFEVGISQLGDRRCFWLQVICSWAGAKQLAIQPRFCPVIWMVL